MSHAPFSPRIGKVCTLLAAALVLPVLAPSTGAGSSAGASGWPSRGMGTGVKGPHGNNSRHGWPSRGMDAGVRGPHGNNSGHGGLFAKIGATIDKLYGFGESNDNGKTGVAARKRARLTAGKGKGGIGSDAGARTGAREGEKMADLDESRRNALETELKKAKELAASQRSALEAELKSAEERAQRAEKNADLATSQRIGLEAELKKAQEKAQLADKITDIVRGQSQAKENGLPNGDPSQKSSDLSANQPKHGQSGPLNPGPTPELDP